MNIWKQKLMLIKALWGLAIKIIQNLFKTSNYTDTEDINNRNGEM